MQVMVCAGSRRVQVKRGAGSRPVVRARAARDVGREGAPQEAVGKKAVAAAAAAIVAWAVAGQPSLSAEAARREEADAYSKYLSTAGVVSVDKEAYEAGKASGSEAVTGTAPKSRAAKVAPAPEAPPKPVAVKSSPKVEPEGSGQNIAFLASTFLAFALPAFGSSRPSEKYKYSPGSPVYDDAMEAYRKAEAQAEAQAEAAAAEDGSLKQPYRMEVVLKSPQRGDGKARRLAKAERIKQMTAEAKQRREAAEAERKAETEKRNAKKLEAIALAEGAAAQRRSEFQKRKEARKLKDKERKKIPKPELKRMRAEESKQRRADAEAKMRAARVAKEERELKVQAGIPEDRTVSQEFIKRAERRARLKEQSKQRRVEAESRLKAEKEAKIQRQLPVISEENILDPAEPVEDGQSNGAEESLKDESTVAGGGPATEKKPINADVRANDDAWNSW